MEKNDLDAVRAAFRGLQSTSRRLLELESSVDDLDGASVDNPPSDLLRAATAHAIAAGALSGLLHRLFTPGGVPPATPLTDSADENAT